MTHGRSDRKKKALVATAHYMARVMLAMLKRGEPWRESVVAEKEADVACDTTAIDTPV